MIVAKAGPAPAPPPKVARPTAAGFQIPQQADAATGPAPPPPASPLDGVLALQEQETDAPRNRQARRHGQALIEALAALQHSLLDGSDNRAKLEHLAMLAQTCPDAADPALTAILGALALRARVELARRGL